MSECTLIAKPPGRRNCRNSSPEMAFKAQIPVPGLLPLIMPLKSFIAMNQVQVRSKLPLARSEDLARASNDRNPR